MALFVFLDVLKFLAWRVLCLSFFFYLAAVVMFHLTPYLKLGPRSWSFLRSVDVFVGTSRIWQSHVVYPWCIWRTVSLYISISLETPV